MLLLLYVSTICSQVNQTSKSFNNYVQGIVPTIMVARVVLAGDTNRNIDTSVITRVSGLQFHRQSRSVTRLSGTDSSVDVETEDPQLASHEPEKWTAMAK